ncbi:hypothetical protein [Acinetobacter gerneri]|uniref:hypothetical protein n=1 Tax=Acinetobacter gerneri TaxID=202952 RepID=UPI0032150A76
MASGLFTCSQCLTEFQRENSQTKRTLKHSNGIIFCSMKCSGLHRRSGKTQEQKKHEKAEYDHKYRERNKAVLKVKKAEYFRKTYDPLKAKQQRKLTMPRHVEYCKSTKYKAYKQKYDMQYRAKKEYGEFWESALIINQLEKEIAERSDFTELAIQKGTLNKRQTRKRNYEQSIKC